MTYRPALLPDGRVPLGRACDFSALVQDVVQRRLDEARPAPAAASQPVSLADQAVPATLQITSFDLYRAVVEGGRYREFAAVVVVADNAGLQRDVTEAEAEMVPAEVFAEAFPLFLTASGVLTRGLLGMPSDTAPTSTATEAETTTTPDS